MENNNNFQNIIERFNYIKNNNKDECILKYLSILKKLLSNLKNKPNEDKYKQIKVTNNILQNSVFNIDGAYDLFIDIGFYQDDESLFIQNIDVQFISNILLYIDGLEIQINSHITARNMDPSITERNKKFADDIENKKKIEMEKLKNDIKRDHKELENRRKDIPITDSKGNQLNFGMNLCKFEPKNEPASR